MHEKDSQGKAANTALDKAPAANGVDLDAFVADLRQQAQRLGFSGLGIARADIAAGTEKRLRDWLAAGNHGDMDYMVKHADLRVTPTQLLPGTRTVISVRLPYWPQAASANEITESASACISRYALGRDYHKTVRQRLQKLAEFMQSRLTHADANSGFMPDDTPFSYRVFSDSAPIMETEFAQRAGIGWRGKHTLTLSRHGSWHFLGEIYTNLLLPPDEPAGDHCGHCRRCLDACPTGAITAPYEVDARRCISYLTIELAGSIPEALRPLIGNRIYGCDDCQQVCPWNRFAKTGDPDFVVRNGLDRASLVALFAWEREDFENRLAGSPIRRIGHERWLRNIAVALGNALASEDSRSALHSRQNDTSPLVREHVAWALAQHARRNQHGA